MEHTIEMTDSRREALMDGLKRGIPSVPRINSRLENNVPSGRWQRGYLVASMLPMVVQSVPAKSWCQSE